jgi:hypothetical protein
LTGVRRKRALRLGLTVLGLAAVLAVTVGLGVLSWLFPPAHHVGGGFAQAPAGLKAAASAGTSAGSPAQYTDQPARSSKATGGQPAATPPLPTGTTVPGDVLDGTRSRVRGQVVDDFNQNAGRR